MGIELSWESVQALLAFGCYLAGVAFLGFFSHRFLTKGSFVNEYFLGSRGLGAWVPADRGGHGHQRRHLHGLSVADLHQRLDHGCGSAATWSRR
jgi:hypothetical protein